MQIRALPVIQTLAAPIAFAVSKFTSPIGPAPHIRTKSPRDTPALLHAWTPTDIGSNKAPSSSDTWSGSLE